ncbi:ras association domain-containing protein 7-like isoform X1 [Mugil cephalus]|uniref:ras association domain-containing protein 7-like isoform X1 n=1 Tax=Mugil cephalus TaxID=48193 RepID=UPI001FB77251|nr:ras association domain-containing protein 7-like isoform X1 [Mugil cephalus]
MELKVWVEGVVRVVCGLSLNTPCQDVVIALAQSIGQTGRYILISKLRGNERHLVADDCPLQHLAQLGQLAAEVQFILRRTGPSLSEGQDTPSSKRRLPLLIPSEPEPIKHKLPQKALTFNLGPSTIARRTKPNGAWSPSPRASPEPQTSPVSFLELPPSSVKALSSHSYKEDVFKQILQQQRRLEDLEIQLQALERESDSWEQKISSAVVPSQSLNLPELLEELEQQLRQNEEELRLGERLEEQFQAEMERERDMHKRLQQIHSSMEDQSYEMRELQTRSAHLGKDLQLRAHRQSPQPGTPLPEEALRSLNQELHNRLQLGEELDATVSKTERALQSAEKRVKDRRETLEDLNKELRQCNLQQFIQQTGSGAPYTDQMNSLTIGEVYLSNAGIME